MKKINVTIKGLLVVWIVTAVAAVLIQVFTSLFSFHEISHTLQAVTDKAMPLQAANGDFNKSFIGVLVRQAVVLSADANDTLMALQDRGSLEKTFSRAMNRAQETAETNEAIRQPLDKLDVAFNGFFTKDAVLLEMKSDILQIEEEQATLAEAIDTATKNIQIASEAIAGKISFAHKRATRRIRKLYQKIQSVQQLDNPEELQAFTRFRDQVGEYFLDRSANLQQASEDIQIDVAMMSALGQRMRTEKSSDALNSIKSNQLAQVVQSVKHSIDKMKAGTADNAELKELVDNLSSEFNVLEKLLNGDRSILSLRIQSIARSADMQKLLTEARSASDAVSNALKAVVSAVDNMQVAAEQDAREVFDQSRNVLLISAATALVVLIGISFVTLRRINRPLAMATSAMRNFAQGNLSNRMDYQGKDEFAVLANDFNELATKIGDLIGNIHRSSDNLASGAERLSTVSGQASQGMEQQQSETAQVATAMNEMAITVQDMARNAAEAERETKRANTEAAKGRLVVDEAVAATKDMTDEVQNVSSVIHRLEEASDAIGTVVDVIRSIAEQTNLLALNAAIEAARAGETGRGFAVVADEVRTLAGRTQESTQEIQSIIETLQQGAKEAVAVIEKGRSKATNSMERVENAGVTLAEIVLVVERIKEMNVHIATAVEQQRAVAEDINQRVVSINNLASQTAEGAKQTAASSQQQARLASELQAMATEFSARTLQKTSH
jgi:methyl-accepting chemotaxis protein